MRAETDNFERRSMSAGIPFIPAAILGGMGWLLGDLERAFIAADCIFPVLLFLLIYRLTGWAVRDRSLRFLVAWGFILIPFGFLNNFWRGDDALIAPLEITRTPQPEISFLILLLAASLTAGAFLKANWRLTIAAGIASGAVVYCYYFYAVGWGITLGLLLLFGLIWRVRRIWLNVLLVLVVMILLAMPFGIATINGRMLGGQSYLLARMGAYTHRANIMPLCCSLLLTVLLLWFGKKTWQKQACYFVLTTLVAGSLFGMNFQIVSGYETQPWHFWKRLGLPLAFFLVTTACSYFVERRLNARMPIVRRSAQLLLVLLLVETTARLVYAGVLAAPFHKESSPDIAILTWARSNLPEGKVVGTVDPEMILLIPALTADYTYVPSGLRSLTPTSEIVLRYDELACLSGLTSSDVAKAAGIPNHLGHSTELLHILGLSYTGDRGVYLQFLDQYRRYAMQCTAPEWRLDDLIIPAGTVPESVRQEFPLARQLYRNSRYELLELRTH
ncbi:MAG: hypothetical protein M3Y24_01460 [Acidobacteriota bacterium]|nr:hypothetical protein [Acidobacteriota bacterium]